MKKLKMKEDFYNKGDKQHIWYINNEKIFDEHLLFTYGIPAKSNNKIDIDVVESFYNNIEEYLYMTLFEKIKITIKSLGLDISGFYNKLVRHNKIFKKKDNIQVNLNILNILKPRLRTIKNNKDVFDYIIELKKRSVKKINYDEIKDNLFNLLVDFKEVVIDINTGMIFSKIDIKGKKYQYTIKQLCFLYKNEL